MRIRELLQKKPGIVVGIAVVVIGLAAWRLWGGSAPTGGRWYYDLTTGELVVMKNVKATRPITLPSGNPGVMAHVFGCGGCEPEQRFIGYLQRLQVHGASSAGAEPGPIAVAIEVAMPPRPGESPVWVPMTSPKATAILNIGRRCPGQQSISCFP